MPLINAPKSTVKALEKFLQENFSSAGESEDNQDAFYATLRRAFNLMEGQEAAYLTDTLQLNESQIRILKLNWSQGIEGQNPYARWYSMGKDLLNKICTNNEFILGDGSEYQCTFAVKDSGILEYEFRANPTKSPLSDPFAAGTAFDISFKLQIKHVPAGTAGWCCWSRPAPEQWKISISEYSVDCTDAEEAFWTSAFSQIPEILKLEVPSQGVEMHPMRPPSP